MFRNSIVTACFSLASCLCNSTVFSREIDYRDCTTCQEAIEKETNEIQRTQKCDHDELSQLHVVRAESYLLSHEYKRAIHDFQKANLAYYKGGK